MGAKLRYCTCPAVLIPASHWAYCHPQCQKGVQHLLNLTVFTIAYLITHGSPTFMQDLFFIIDFVVVAYYYISFNISTHLNTANTYAVI